MARTMLEARGTVWSPDSGRFTLGPLSLRAEEGRFIALVGPNGAGKSTVLRLMAGLLNPSAGQVFLKGHIPGDYRPRTRARLLAYLSQDPEKPFGFPVSQYISLGRYPYIGPLGLEKAKDRIIVQEEILRWGLEKLAEQPVSTLSGGEFQRVRLARAFAQRPKVLLLDEPGNHLDLKVRSDILCHLQKKRNRGALILAVLHDVNDALTFADEAWLFNDGKLLCSGRPRDVLTADRLKDLYGTDLHTYLDEEGRILLGLVSPEPGP